MEHRAVLGVGTLELTVAAGVFALMILKPS